MLGCNLYAQSFDAIAAKYPNNQAVIQNFTKTITISLKNGEPFAQSKTGQEILALDDKANGLYNRQYVFSSSYNDFTSLEDY